MKKQFITINEIEEDKIMSPYEMKNVIGGSNDCASDCTGECTASDGITGRCGWTSSVGCTCASITIGK